MTIARSAGRCPVLSGTMGERDAARPVLVPLSKGRIAVIDAEFADVVLPISWHAVVKPNGCAYGRARVSGVWIWMHRLIANAEPGLQVDHIDGDGLNNRLSNLRLATQAENVRNRTRRRPFRFLKGVQKIRDGCFQAKIGVNGRRLHIGCFKTEIRGRTRL